ncbi:sensor domain-containing diguanylate cyclase [Fibrobacter sp. UWEL]|uniref:sensor domain-containing diguanylate cyclase n=1 Tax=Fibrobacter sp. UWEL TaxID=1896209 RepID=UPI001F2BD270|nr:sensor domain-containing diguanylate cyclase [Fibrobacter sp. UWEL]
MILTVSMTLAVLCGVYIYTQKQMTQIVERAFSNGKNLLAQKALFANDEMVQFGKRLKLLARTSEIQSMDPIVVANYLKSYSVSDLFNKSELVTVYDKANNFICNNSMVGMENENTYPVDFTRLTPHNAYNFPWYRDHSDPYPKRIVGINIANRAQGGDGNLIAVFSASRIWKKLESTTPSQHEILVAVNGNGEILYHPDLNKWVAKPHKISELGINIPNIKTYSVPKPEFITSYTGKQYLVNFEYNPDYDLGLFLFQPKSDIDAQAATTKQISLVIMIVFMIVIAIMAIWMYRLLGRPLNTLIYHISRITNGELDIAEIKVGKRNDEIGRLAATFNQMHETIRRQIEELNSHRDMLEQEVKERTKELEEANRRLDMISKTDELTGLPNRREMNETIANEIGRTQRSNKPFCFIFIDIDHFKAINDTYGHACGDEILKAVAQTVRGLLRKYDVFARYGGEEFLTLLPETDLEGAAIVAERFRRKIEMMTVHYGDYTINITITLGVSRFDHRLGADRSIQMADKALYQGKESGRNQVVVWQPEWVTDADYEAAAIELAELQKSADKNQPEA